MRVCWQRPRKYHGYHIWLLLFTRFFINNKQAKFGGEEVISSIIIMGYGAYSNNSHGRVNYSHHSIGDYLVSNSLEADNPLVLTRF
jgi:hypothetical protein